MQLYYSPDYIGAGHDFDTTRKAKWIADSLNSRPIAGAQMCTPVSATVADIERVHAHDYVTAVRTGSPLPLAESQGFEWDPDLWPMVLASNGGVLAAARAALTDGVAGSLSSGLHHAKYDRGDGFCTFNGLVITAKSLLASGEVTSVLILDLDAHCGGGTAALIADDQRILQLDVSVSLFDAYPPQLNSQLDEVSMADDYLPAVHKALAEADQSSWDLVIYNAGMDPYQGCDIGGLDGITGDILAEREQVVFDWCRQRSIPIAFVLAGGYIGADLSREGLVNLHRQTISAAVHNERMLVASGG